MPVAHESIPHTMSIATSKSSSGSGLIRLSTNELYKQHLRQRKREVDQRDKERAHRGRMTAAEFARLNDMTPAALRQRMRRAGYKRLGNRNHIPIKDLEKFL